MNIATEGATEKKTCVVVNENDETLYVGNLAECHTQPMVLHRAFSLFVFDKEGRLLLQQRAKTKYTFPLSWTNTVCSHPRTEEKFMEEWIDIRMQDELGWAIKNIRSRLQAVGKLTYEAFSDFKYGEKEIDTLYVIEVSEDEKEGLHLNPEEVEAIDWVEPNRLTDMMNNDSVLLTPWFRAIASSFGSPFHQKIKGQHMKEGTGTSPQDDDFPWFRVGNVSMPKADPYYDFLLQGPYSYMCSNPGKQLRTALVKLYGEFDKDLSKEDARSVAAIVERVHAASLLHDDIEDRSSTRRGAVCAHLLWGTAQTINTGTFNFIKAIHEVDTLMKHHNVEKRYALSQCVSSMLLDLHRGQNADLYWGDHAMCPTAAEYIAMIDHKTGALFKACAQLGALCTGNTAVGQVVADLFVQLGRFFQIRDDLCNICDPHYWSAKGFYEDADEGKYSYPVLVMFGSGLMQQEEEQEWLRVKLADREAPMTIEDKLRAYTLLFVSGALKETRDYCLAKSKSLGPLLGKNSPIAQKILSTLSIPEIKTPEQVAIWISEN